MHTASYEPLPQNGDAYLDDVPDSPANDSSSKVERSTPSRPDVYYNDGPFSPPSSPDESRENLLEKLHVSPSTVERGVLDIEGSAPSHSRRISESQRKSPLKFLTISILSLLLLAVVIGIFAAISYSGKASRKGSRHITMDHVFNGTFWAERNYLNWVPEAGDGVYSVNENGVIKLVDLKTNSTTDILRHSDVRDSRGRELPWSEWQISPDMNYVLVKTDTVKQWRHSSFSNYYIHKLADHSTHPIAPPQHPPLISYATWSPTGESIAFVSQNDLYILPSADAGSNPIRVTHGGNSSVFFGIPDWVYEEEVFSGPSALWWSPDSQRIAYLRFDETSVNEYTFPKYNPTGDSSIFSPYTNFVTMKYPKPGYPNPLVSIHIFALGSYQSQTTASVLEASAFTQELTWRGRGDVTDSIIQEISWVSNTTVLVKEVNRAADDGSVAACSVEQAEELVSCTMVRKLGKNGEQGDDGWIDSDQNVHSLPASLGLGEGAYLDILPTKDGYNQIALFHSSTSTQPRWLTSGKTEVTGILSVDAQRRLVYYLDAGTEGIGRRLYSVLIPADPSDQKLANPVALTEEGTQQPSYFSASFSPQSGYYVLGYEGPDIPWQKIVKVDDSASNYILTSNERLQRTMNQFQKVTRKYSTVRSNGYEINAVEIRPPNMDESGRIKYPVLFRVYGGPGSQLVDTKFNIDWHNYLVCSLKYIVVIVDGRGTGYKGRRLRNPVKGRLGVWETQDQINAAKAWESKKYVDSRRIGIWGWSYGGYMAAKVVEADGGVHSLAISVAPVTSWRLYDTIYTERYMGLPNNNRIGYHNASITNVTAFNKVNYLLAHGSGDDNVHFANTAHLLDMLTQHHVRGFRFRMFTDSDHSIATRGANRELYEWMTDYLIEKWGKGIRRM